MYGFEDFLTGMSMLFSGQPFRGEVVGSEKFDNDKYHIYVDTCFTNDTGKFETAVQVNDDDIVIVEQYDTKEAAIAGHKSWVNACKQKEFHFFSVQDGSMYLYKT